MICTEEGVPFKGVSEEKTGTLHWDSGNRSLKARVCVPTCEDANGMESSRSEAMCVIGSRIRRMVWPKAVGVQVTSSKVPDASHGTAGFGVILLGFSLVLAY